MESGLGMKPCFRSRMEMGGDKKNRCWVVRPAGLPRTRSVSSGLWPILLVGRKRQSRLASPKLDKPVGGIANTNCLSWDSYLNRPKLLCWFGGAWQGTQSKRNMARPDSQTPDDLKFIETYLDFRTLKLYTYSCKLVFRQWLLKELILKISFVEVQNFRKLKSIRIDFDGQTTIFVGANNSGKTSAMLALRYFLL